MEDIEAAKRFYVDVVGLKIERFHPRFVQFPGFAIATGEAMNGGKERELYWLVDDARDAFVELPSALAASKSGRNRREV